MMFQRKSPVWTLSILISVVLLQFLLPNACGQLSIHTPSTCIPECGAGYECVTGLCVRQQCSTDCSGEERQVVCGSNGVNYNNLCELEKARCELALDISLESHGPCMTVPPPPASLCRDHQREYDSRTSEQFTAICNLTSGYAKYNDGTLEYSDVVNCYRPQCSQIGQYLVKQCSITFSGYCWCSTPDGGLVPNTFQRNISEGYCNGQLKCDVGGGCTIRHGEVFTPTGVCGFCECLNGSNSCFINIDLNGTELSSEQLHSLKQDLLQVFNFQINHNDHTPSFSDIRFVRNNPVGFTSQRREELLEWKFNYYDANGNSRLDPVEEFVFKRDLFELFRCSQFFNQVSRLMDLNGDHTISKPEWMGFFNASGTIASDKELLDQADQMLEREVSMPLLWQKN